MGQNSGKAVLTYERDDSADTAIKQFDNRAVDGLICKVKPFFESKGESAIQKDSLLARRLYLMNVPYDSSSAELEAFVSEFVPVDMAVIPRDRAGLAHGYAFVYLKEAADMERALEYCDGRHLRSRQIRAKRNIKENKTVTSDSQNDKVKAMVEYLEMCQRRM